MTVERCEDAVLRELEQRRVLNTRGWNVVILTGDQIKEQQRMDAHRSVEE